MLFIFLSVSPEPPASMSVEEVLVFRQGPLHLDLPSHRVIGHFELREQPLSIVEVDFVEQGEIAFVEMLEVQYRVMT